MLDDAINYSRSDPNSDQAPSEASPQLWSISYHSRPTARFSGNMLESMLEQAQSANQRRGISGLLVAGETDFVQWLEGSQAALRSLMERIQIDPRHSDITLLDSRPLGQRLFAEWSMLFVDEVPNAAFHLPPMLAQPSNLINELKYGSEIGDVFKDLSVRAHREQGVIDTLSQASEAAKIKAQILPTNPSVDRLVRDQILPELARRARRSNSEEPTRLVGALAHAALEQDAKTIRSILRHVSLDEVYAINAQVSLLEHTERRLGDMWQENACSESDIILALFELVTALRAVSAETLPIKTTGDAPPAVLVISQPGELHMLPALLDAEVLNQHGWETVLDFPRNDDVLADRVAEDWFDAVDISLSDVFRRNHYLQHVAQTITAVRQKSRNEHIAITVGGRAFRDDVGLLMSTGADRLVPSANDIEWAMSDALRTRKRLART
ncbi:MAG: BLUF domain-containing protein [Pseudomonadota bacterium]